MPCSSSPRRAAYHALRARPQTRRAGARARGGGRRLARRLLALLLPVLAPAAGAAEPAFEVQHIPVEGRTVAAELVDLDGDALADLVHVDFLGIPPRERRVLRVHHQSAAAGLPATPSFEADLPPGSVAYDVADLLPEPGSELVLLRRDGVALLSLATPGMRLRSLPVRAGATVGPAEDERGLERIRLVWRGFGSEPWLLVPLLGQIVALTPDGEERARLEVGGRANYYAPPRRGLGFRESDLQLYYDTPHLSVGDVDGDGRSDVVAAGRHEVRVFLRRDDGSFPIRPDRRLALRLVSERDHVRGSGGVSAAAFDLDGDAALDLLVTHVSGSFADARVDTYVYQNRNGGWDLPHPDRSFRTPSSIGSDTPVDLDGDGQVELVRTRISFSSLELVEALLTSAVDVRVSVHRREDPGLFAVAPSFELKLGLPIDFETFRPAGFLANFDTDLDGDGRRDLVSSRGGDAIEVRSGAGARPYRRRMVRQELDTRGQLRIGDLDGDGLPDLLIFDPQHANAGLRLLRNRTVSRGTPRDTRRSD